MQNQAMNVPSTLQIQSVLYHNDRGAILKTVESIANAAKIALREGTLSERPVLRYGDASKTPLFNTEDLSQFEEICGDFLCFDYVFFNENTGTSRGLNRLAKGCNTGFIMTMNPDILVNPRIFSQLLGPYSRPELNAGMTEARQTPVEHHKEYDPETGITCWASGACFISPTAVYHAIDGFDADTFFMYCDDIDYSWRVRLLGYNVIYVPSAPVFHAKSLSPSAEWQPSGAEQYYSAEAGLLMAYKWSADEKLEEIIHYFTTHGEDYQKKALESFYRLKKEGRLPKQLDPEHKVAEFTGHGYGNYRFSW